MDKPPVDDHLSAPIAVILGRWPGASRIFIQNRMGCIGCAFAKYHTLQDAFAIYQLDKEALIGQMRVLMGSKDDLEPSEA